MATQKLTPRMGFVYPTEENVAWYSVYKSMMLQMDAAAFASREDRNAILSGGGTIEWNAGTLIWGSSLDVLSPTTGALGQLAAGSLALGDGDCVLVTLTRYATVTYSLASSTAQSADSDDNSFVLCRRSGSTLYWRNGVTMPDGYVGTLGVRLLSDDIMDALEAAEAPAAGNPFVTESAMDAAILAATPTIHASRAENLTAQVNGVTHTFTTTHAFVPGSLRVFLNGLNQMGTGDGLFVETNPAAGVFTLIPLTTPPDTVYVSYAEA